MADRLQIAPRHRRILEALLRKHLPGVEVRAYGSRVNGRGHDGGDLDLVLRAPDLQKLPAGQLLDFEDALRESTIPFLVEARDWACLPKRFHRKIERDYVVMSGSFASEPPDSSRLDDWKPINLGRACTKIGSGATPRGGKDVYMTNGPYALIRSQNVFNDGFRHDGLAYIGEQHALELAGVEVRERDVLLNITGDSVARACLVAPDVLPARVNQHVVIIRPDPAKLDPHFLRYLLVCPTTQAKLLSWAGSGGTRNALTKGMIEALDVPVPEDVAEQRSIAQVLGTLDDKIELNRRMNATLEAMARALFKSWFVDFDPVRAKMEGRNTGLPKGISDLFPDRLVDSELGKVPLGWPVENLASHFEAVKGVSYKGSGLGDDGTPLHNLNSIHEGGGYKHEGIKYYSGEYAERHRVRPGDVIVANTEQGHNRLLIGYAAIVPATFGTDGITSHHIYRLRSRPATWLTSRFLLFLLNSTCMHDLVSGYANGTTVNMLPIDGVQRPPVMVPPRSLVETFDTITSCSEHRREQTVRESRTLTHLRDKLLPMLVSGELQVPVEDAPSVDASGQVIDVARRSGDRSFTGV